MSLKEGLIDLYTVQIHIKQGKICMVQICCSCLRFTAFEFKVQSRMLMTHYQLISVRRQRRSILMSSFDIHGAHSITGMDSKGMNGDCFRYLCRMLYHGEN